MAIGDASLGWTRWTYQRKAALVAAIEEGSLTPEAVERLYGITPAELRQWRARFAADGKEGLRVYHGTDHVKDGPHPNAMHTETRYTQRWHKPSKRLGRPPKSLGAKRLGLPPPDYDGDT